jgi:Protein of unknown function (DUF2946)
VFRKATQRRLVTWLALFAVWLAVAAPVISQVLPFSDTHLDLGAWCTGHGLADHASGAASDPHALHADKCGYCGLLGHSPALSGDAILAPEFARFSQRPHVHTELPAVDARPRLSASPRGPPLIG